MERQTEKFAAAEKRVRDAGSAPEIFHLANSAAVASRPASWRSMVRPGLALYRYSLPLQRGGDLQPETPAALALRPVLSWKTLVLSVHDAPAGQALGYGGTFFPAAPPRIAVFPLGAADGLVRKILNRGPVIVLHDS